MLFAHTIGYLHPCKMLFPKHFSAWRMQPHPHLFNIHIARQIEDKGIKIAITMLFLDSVLPELQDIASYITIVVIMSNFRLALLLYEFTGEFEPIKMLS